VELLRDWYLLLSGLSAAVSGPLAAFARWLDLPLASAFLLGLVGAAAPCQLTTNTSAMAYLSRGGSRRAAGREAGAFLLGKVVVYTALGGLGLGLADQLQRVAIPVALVTRRALGPVLLVMGLGLLGVIRLRGSFGTALGARLRAGASGMTRAPAFAMGAGFALAFCPTLFWLFFGLTVPLGLESPVGFVFPALFAVGTSVPVLLLGTFLATGAPADTSARLARASRILTRVAGVVFVLAGLNDTLTYWAL
jgi:hypothetical protein